MMPSPKIKWFSFLAIGWASHLLAIACLWKLSWYFVGYSSALKFGLVLLFLLIGWAVLSAVVGSIGPNKNYNFLLSPYKSFYRYKWIYHGTIGYMLMRIDADSITIMETGLLYVNEEYEMHNTGNVRETARQVREYLDRLGENRLQRRAEENIRRQRIKAFEEWDGYLDRQDARENKIWRILGRK